MKKHVRPSRSVPIALLLLGLAALAAPTAHAQCGSPATSTIPAAFTVCPSGDIGVTAIIRDATGAPCVGSAIAMTVNFGCLCNAPLSMSGVTNAAGAVTFFPSLGGYCSTPGLVDWIDAAGNVLGQSTVINSPDINGDCAVNLTDIAFFSQALFGGIGVAAADFNFDGVVNLQDVPMMAKHIGH